jgi:hypothetical protein
MTKADLLKIKHIKSVSPVKFKSSDQMMLCNSLETIVIDVMAPRTARDSSDKEYKRNKGLRCASEAALVSSLVESSNSARKVILKARKSQGLLVGSIDLDLGLKARRENLPDTGCSSRIL